MHFVYRENADCFGSAFDLSVETFDGIVCPNSSPVLTGKIHIG